MNPLRKNSAALLTGALLFSMGCGGASDKPELADVEGTVKMSGEPLPGVQVVFGPARGRSSFAITDDQGHYVLMYTFDEPGAVIGHHKVAISTPLEDESDPDARYFVDPIPPQYNSKTTLKADVVAGNNVIDFDLESR